MVVIKVDLSIPNRLSKIILQTLTFLQIDGVASATKDVVFTFLQRSTRQGGKVRLILVSWHVV